MDKVRLLEALMRGLVLVCGLATLLTMSALAQTPPAEVRLALVIGISDYNGDGDTSDNDPDAAAAQGVVTDLRNPGNDAADVAAELQPLNFNVTTVINPNRDQLIDALIGFGERVEAARSAGSSVTTFVFYAGHGMQVEGVNYIIPSQARLPQQNLASMPARQAQTLLETRAISFATLVNQLPHDPGDGVNIVVLDACRNNPWERRVRATVRGPNERGLADERFDHRRTLIAFSAQPGMVAADGQGRNSPFTEALLEHIRQPNVSVKDMFDDVGSAVEARIPRQIPWTNAPSLSRYCLAGCNAAATTVVAVSDPCDEARHGWGVLFNSTSISALEAFAQRTPSQCEFGDLARSRIAELRRSEATSLRQRSLTLSQQALFLEAEYSEDRNAGLSCYRSGPIWLLHFPDAQLSLSRTGGADEVRYYVFSVDGGEVTVGREGPSRVFYLSGSYLYQDLIDGAGRRTRTSFPGGVQRLRRCN